MSKKNPFLIFLIIVMLILSGCAAKNKADTNLSSFNDKSSTKIKVMVSFNPLKEFAEAIGKDKIEINTMVPQGAEPHDFEPRARDMERLGESQIFIYNGLDMEGWVPGVLQGIGDKNLVVVEASKGCSVIRSIGQNDESKSGQYDPHTWLSLTQAKIECGNIKDALIKVDPTNKNYYENNYREFTSQLNSLYNTYRIKFDSLKNKNFVTGHAAFAYLCRDFNLTQNSLENVFAEGEPSPTKLSDMVDYCRKNNVRTIFMEEMVSPKVSETLANEIGAKVQKIYTIESMEDNKNYIEAMKENLQNIYNSLK